MKHNVTIRDVAKQAGVSVATISRVLNQSAYVSPEIERAVLEAISELGYYHNSAARSLKTNTSMIIGFVTADISNPYMITVAREIEDLICERKYSLLVCSTHGMPTRELDYLKLLMSRDVDGLVLNGTGHNLEFITEISKQIPIVLVNRTVSHPGFEGDLVDSDNEEGLYKLTKHLVTIGHRRVFAVKGSNVSSTWLRFKGFSRAMEEVGVKIDESYPYQYGTDFSPETGRNAIAKIMSLKPRPTAVVAMNNTLGLGLLQGLKAHNLRAPDDISVAHYNSIDYHEMMTVRPMMYDVNPSEIGRAAGHALLDRIDAEKMDNREIIINGRIIAGNAVSLPFDCL
ncbi:MAG: LacI family transcriptional regulator [Clostridiales bacterium]|jgi:LacI family transcriptional regulator|nr:LacI family transcriptional regulator [Clostridiales bacterium]